MTGAARECDALVLGGGPAGATAAAVLAAAGKRTVVVEKTRFPRYSVGESLMPWCFFPLERTGALAAVRRAAFVHKYSVEFIGLEGKVSRPFYFFEQLDHEAAQTWQVQRADFDRILLDNAKERGAEVVRGAARGFLRGGAGGNGPIEGARIETADGEETVSAPITLDCTGRDALAARLLGWRVLDPKLRKVSLWSYFRGGRRNPGRYDEGATTIALLPRKGWFWYIPLANDEVSVGVTADAGYLYREGRDPEAIFSRELRVNPWVRDNLESAERIAPVRATGDYSYRSRHCAADGLALVGDAFAFLDPVYSSGVFLALWSGEKAADAAAAALDAGDTRAARFTEYGRELTRGIEAMRKLVYAFYDEGFRMSDLVRQRPELAGDVTELLTGNLFRDYDALRGALAERAALPDDLSYGLPVGSTPDDTPAPGGPTSPGNETRTEAP